MRNAAHVDRGEDGGAKSPAFQQSGSVNDGRVEAHVLVHGEDDAGGLAGLDNRKGFGVIEGERFLSQDSFDGASLAGCPDEGGLMLWRDGDVEYFDGGIVEEVVDRIVNGRDVMGRGDLFSVGFCARCYGSGVESLFAIGREMAIIDDEATADDSDAGIGRKVAHDEIREQAWLLKRYSVRVRCGLLGSTMVEPKRFPSSKALGYPSHSKHMPAPGR